MLIQPRPPPSSTDLYYRAPPSTPDLHRWVDSLVRNSGAAYSPPHGHYPDAPRALISFASWPLCGECKEQRFDPMTCGSHICLPIWIWGSYSFEGCYWSEAKILSTKKYEEHQMRSKDLILELHTKITIEYLFCQKKITNTYASNEYISIHHVKIKFRSSPYSQEQQ
jgi:hypothetical protein